MIPFRSEWHRLTSSRTAIALLVVFVVTPMVLVGTVLWSQWAPMARSSKVPAAIVNQDQPVSQDGKQLAAGETLTNEILANKELDWKVTTASDADDGLRSGRYYAVVQIPADYSANVESLGTASPRQASIQLRTNDATSVLTPVVASKALASVDRLAEQQIQSGYLDAVYSALGLGTDATSKNVEKSGAVLKSAQTMNASATRTSQQADAAASQSEAQQSSTGATADAAAATDEAAKTAEATAGKLPTPAAAVRDGSAQALADIQQLQAELTSAGQGQFAAEAATIAAEMQSAVIAPADTVINLSGQAASQTTTTRERADDAASTASATNTAAGMVTQAAQASATSAQATVTEATTMLNGAQTLNTSMVEFTKRTPPAFANQKETYAKILNDPVNSQVLIANQVRAVGDGITSQFVPAALLLGALGTLLFVPALLPRLRLAGAGALRLVAASAMFPLAVSGAQVVLLLAVLVAMGMRAAAWLPLIGMLLLTAVCAVAIVQLLRAWLGVLGTFVAMLFIFLQLAASAGALPAPALSGIYSVLEPAMPMTYAADGIRRAIAGGDLAPHLLIDAGVLVIVTVVAWGLTVLVASRRRMVVIADVRPGIQPV
ncbi:MAG: putative rane protein [Actinomycetota bacterium]|nr:putative rane protein [Actinomycetota bacterium]